MATFVWPIATENHQCLRCSSERCPVRWKLKKGLPGPLTGFHDHDPTPWILNQNTMIKALKRRAASETISLNAIYEEEAARHNGREVCGGRLSPRSPTPREFTKAKQGKALC